MDGQKPHRRKNPLTGDWVLVSPHRAERPWKGAVEAPPLPPRPSHDPDCYLCPRNSRAQGIINPDYEGPFVFDNDFPALLPSKPEAIREGWKESRTESGTCRVICYSPRHDASLAELAPLKMLQVLDTWIVQLRELYTRLDIGYVQIFENKGEVMGCSNPHPHGQIWATRDLPNEIEKENRAQLTWMRVQGECLLCRIARDEAAAAERVVCENADWLAVVPFWAVWPFETMLLPRRHAGSLLELDAAQKDALIGLLRQLFGRYDRLFGVPMPLSWGWHLTPRAGDGKAWHLHAHFYPPLLRSASVRKFMVGYEMLGGPQRDLTPEGAAQKLREA